MQSTNVLILGGGPAGYVAALRTAQAGLATVLVESDHPGGTCLNIGCIPSKALIHAADEFHKLSAGGQAADLGIEVGPASIDLARLNEWKAGIIGRLTGGVQSLLKQAGVRVVHGTGHVLDGKTVEVTPAESEGRPQRFVCQHLVLATGSEPAALSMLPFGGRVVSSTEALFPQALPATLAVVGGGYIGLELGIAYAKLGTRVTLIEARGNLLPSWDAALSRPVQKRLADLGVEVLLNTRVQDGDPEAGRLHLLTEGAQIQVREFDQVLVAVGRKPRSQTAGIDRLMLDMDGPFIRVDEQGRTSMRQVWAIGDITGEPMLAHRAMAQAEVVAAVIAGQRRRFEPLAIPAVCYADPEVVVSGLLPDEARARHGDVLTASFPFAHNGRALTLEAAEGFVRVVAKRDDHRIVGWQAVGTGVSELAAAFTQSIEMCARLEDVAGTIHAHPTLSEAIQEAALKALGTGLHG